MDTYSEYQADTRKPSKNKSWLLHGAGFENFLLVEEDIPVPGPKEMLVRIDCVSICFSDVKLIRAGNKHPRVLIPLEERPTSPGHEISLTVIEPGEKMKDRFTPGERFIIQAEIKMNGEIDTFGYTQRGGMATYVLLRESALDGDDGCYLLPVKDTTGFSEAATVEPWACVVCAYHIARPKGFSAENTVLFADGIPSALGESVKEEGAGSSKGDPDRIFLPATMGEDAYREIEDSAARGAVLAFLNDEGAGKIPVDAGSLHYRDLRVISGTSENIIDQINEDDRKDLKQGGSAFFVGSGGPMGQMHIQRAIEMNNHPAKIAVSDISEERLQFMHDKFDAMAQAKGIELKFFDARVDTLELREQLLEFSDGGFDDIVINAPLPVLVTESQYQAGQGCIINIFAGIPIGSPFVYDTEVCAEKKLRFTGSSGSAMDDLRRALEYTESGEINSDAIVRAVGGLNVLKKGVESVANSVYPGKVVIYPHLENLPLMSVEECGEKYPAVKEKMNGVNWTREAERELFNTILGNQ